MNNNVFNLTDYFKEEYGYTFTTISDLLTAPFIEYEGTGAFALFWVTMQNEKYLFKEVNKSTYTWLGELLSEEYAKILDIPCAEYKICKLGDKYGILSKKFTKSNESVILGAEIIQNVLDKYPYLLREHLLEDEYFLDLYNIPESIVQMKREHRLKYLYNNLNNIEELWSIISIYLDLHKQDKQFEKNLYLI